MRPAFAKASAGDQPPLLLRFGLPAAAPKERRLVGLAGFGPATPTLKARCSSLVSSFIYGCHSHSNISVTPFVPPPLGLISSVPVC